MNALRRERVVNLRQNVCTLDFGLYLPAQEIH
jgi:hypothetical protein